MQYVLKRLFTVSFLGKKRARNVINPIQNATGIRQALPNAIRPQQGIIRAAVGGGPAIRLRCGGQKVKIMSCESRQQSKKPGSVFIIHYFQDVITADQQ
jgi:hypothetical protein